MPALIIFCDGVCMEKGTVVGVVASRRYEVELIRGNRRAGMDGNPADTTKCCIGCVCCYAQSFSRDFDRVGP